jgi:DNA (cytosine-5)-methyltransferase 1
MNRPLILDLFSGAGGCAVGYHRAGFDVVGVDKVAQPRYPFPFVQADALGALTDLLAGGFITASDGRAYCLADFAAIHGSPVCKLWSAATPAAARANHIDYITPLRPLLEQTGLPWVMENVPGAPLRPDLMICGCQVGLHELERERWFETNWATAELRPPCYHATSPITVAGHGEPSGPRLARGVRATVIDWRRAMGIDWMTRDELAQAIPPAYTEHIGAKLLEHLEAAAA